VDTEMKIITDNGGCDYAAGVCWCRKVRDIADAEEVTCEHEK